MSLTKETHTYIAQTILYASDKGKREFREYIHELIRDDVHPEWTPLLQFYYDQSANAVVPRCEQWNEEDWNIAANEIYRYKFLGSGDHVDELISRFNTNLENLIVSNGSSNKSKERKKETMENSATLLRNLRITLAKEIDVRDARVSDRATEMLDAKGSIADWESLIAKKKLDLADKEEKIAKETRTITVLKNQLEVRPR